VSTRTYLSIGDVLTLLREEFPDVTISKIRFLESQGLVNPERSPSGYRKFFEADVERLRWVLRQQREHFLPLKVIRDRLADGELDTGGDGQNGKPAPAPRSAQPVHAGAGAGAGARPEGTVSAPGDEPTKADEEAMARILADASRRAARLPDDAPARRGLQVVNDEQAGAATATAASVPASAATVPARAQAPAESAAHAQARRSGAGKGASTAAQGVPTPAPAPAGGAAGARAPDGPGAPRGGASSGGANSASRRSEGAASSARTGSGGGQGGARKSPAHAAGDTATGSGSGTGASAAVVTGASLTAEELAAATGLSPDEVAGLVSFGLIEPVSVAGIETFDEDCLTVANLAASFRNYGIEPRHLRMFRNAVDREIGLIEQVVIPLLRQRNPESRQRAVESADELGALGQSMRATLLRQGLRRHLGG
jgi:DNA-binding transcriptional MerR regulator